MSRYSQERKEAISKKLLPPPQSRSEAEVVKEEDISDATQYYWRKQLQETGAVVPNSYTSSER